MAVNTQVFRDTYPQIPISNVCGKCR